MKKKEAFVEFLDTYKYKSDFCYSDLCLILRASNDRYITNAFSSKLYSPIFLNQTEFLSFPQMPTIQHFDSRVIPSDDYYEFWKKKHEYDFCPPLLEKPKIKTKKHIDISFNTFGDLLRILSENEYSDDVEYNIDLKALFDIKSELEKLNEMIGMENFKNAILDQILYFIQNLHLGKEPDFKNMILCGPPGTGKTEIAKILGTMYSKIGVLKNNIFKKVTRSDLIAGYLGQTAIKTKKVITECLGGCLFIDEAYSLANSERDDSYSKECLDTLCESMSEYKESLMVIIAGYEEELYDTFFKANKGLESRFIWRFKIDEYSAKELMQIFLKKVKENEWSFEVEETNPTLLKWFESKKSSFKHFGRDMELLFSYTKISHGRRIYGLSSDLRKKMNLDDLDKGYKYFLTNTNQKKTYTIHGLYV